MTYIPQIGADKANSTYNAVKIRINNPQTNIPEGFKNDIENRGIYNAVDIEVNRPAVNTYKNPVYNYPQTTRPITYDMTGIGVQPALPVAYQTNFINNRTLINAEFEYEQAKKDDIKKVEADFDEIVVPAPNLTTTEKEKTEISFHGISFRANEPTKKIEIVPAEEIKPDVDIPKVLSKLSDKNYDVQAQQMEEIARLSAQDSQKAVPYIVKEVFVELINIAKKDTTNLTPPSQEQIDARRKLIINEIIKEQAKQNGLDVEKIELPYLITEEDRKLASTLTDMEQAERNKEYALYTMAILAKVYTDDVQKHTGNVVPMTDLPGVSVVVDTLRYDKNSGVKLAALEALHFMKRPEYKEELEALYTLAANDESSNVAGLAARLLEDLNR